mgnify:CR=1 FL=1
MGLKIWLNDGLVDEQDAKVSVFDHGLLYGDGVFEGIRVYEGNVFRLKEHIDRLFESAKTISLDIGMTPEQQGRLFQAFSQAEYLLTALTRETGGRVYFPAALSELDAVYDRIAEELRTLYSVGYVSSNARRDGKWRRIVVRVPERDGVSVRHKLGYYAPGS